MNKTNDVADATQPTREEMIAFLEKHFRYNTMNSWNNSTSYAKNVKIHKLGLTRDQEKKAYELLELRATYENITDRIREFAEEHDYQWQAGFNGRSGGYIVMYQGGCKIKRNFDFKPDDPDDKRDYSDRFGRWYSHREAKEMGIAYSTHKQVYCTPGKNVDMDADFGDWEDDEIQRRYELVKEFDKMVEDCIAEFRYLIDNYNVVEKEVPCVRTVKTLEPIAAEAGA
jgi:hypothetical protein